MLLLKSPSMENRAPSIRTRIASRSKAIFWSLCQTRMIRKNQKSLPLLSKVITPKVKTIGASVSNEMSCEIYDNAKLLMQNPTERFSCCYSRASNLRQAVTKIPLCRMICMKMFWFSVITSLPPVHGAIACWDSAPFVSTSPAMIASVAV